MTKRVLLLIAMAASAAISLAQQIGGVGVPGGAAKGPGYWPSTIYSGPYTSYFDDYLTSANVSSGSALGSGSPTGSCAASTTYLDNTSPGNISITGTSSSSVTSTGWGCVEAGGIYQLFNPATAPYWVYETRVSWASLPGTTGASYQVGLSHTYLASPWTTGIGFYLSSNNANANHIYCEYGATPTLTDTGVTAVASTWTRLSILNDGTNMHWFINGVEATACKTATSNMPTLSQYMGFTAVPTAISTTVTMGIDYLQFQMATVR